MSATDLQTLLSPSITDALEGNVKLMRFVKAYDGDLVYALRVAGFAGTDKYLQHYGEELLTRPNIQYAIQQNTSRADKKEGALLSKVERMEFLSSLVRNNDPYERMIKDDYGQEVPPPPPSMNERLKALDMYNKMEGDYQTNLNVNHNVNLQDLVLDSFTGVTRDIDSIEAEYINMKEGTGAPIPSLDTLGL